MSHNPSVPSPVLVKPTTLVVNSMTPVIRSSVHEPRKPGELFLPSTPEESTMLFTLVPSFTTARSSAFMDPRYRLPSTIDHTTFPLPAFRRTEVGSPPRVYYPMSLIQVWPSTTAERTFLVLADGRTLYLALCFVRHKLYAVIGMDESGLVISPVKDVQKFKKTLDDVNPALVCTPCFFFYPYFLSYIGLNSNISRRFGMAPKTVLSSLRYSLPHYKRSLSLVSHPHPSISLPNLGELTMPKTLREPPFVLLFIVFTLVN